MAISERDKRELNAIHNEYGKPGRGKKEDYFALMYLMKRFKVSAEEIIHQIAFGNNDYGIDAYHIDREARNLYLYQFKWSENHSLFKESMERLTSKGIIRIFGNPLQDPNQNEYLRYLKQDIEESREIIDRVYIHFVFKGDIKAAENSEGLASRREDIENKAHLIEHRFDPRQVELRVDFISDRRLAPPAPELQTHSIRFDGATCATYDDKKMHVGLVPIFDLYNIYKSLREKFFDRNIRSGLSPDNPPNKKIREALAAIVIKKETPATVFAFNHNGVTLAAERVTPSDARLTLHVPRLLNGAQTLTSFVKFLELYDEHPAIREKGTLLQDIRVLAKVIEAEPASDFVTQVTISNNQQNPVEPWMLRAMDRRQVDLADKFRDEVHIFYSRQEGAFDNLSDDERRDQGIDDPKDIKIRPLAQTFLAVQGEVDKMSRLREVFENKATYESTFRAGYLNADARNIVLCYKIGMTLNTAMEALRELAPQKFRVAMIRARYLVWALLIQAVLNDPKLAEDREEFGTNLARKWTFLDRIEKLTRSRVYPIIRKILAMRVYKERIEEEKYEFLRTKEVFSTAMRHAEDLFRWSKKSL